MSLLYPAILDRVGPWEIVLILLVILLLFGAKRLPELARSVGRSIREFKRGTREIQDEIERTGEEPDRKELPPRDQAPAGDRTLSAKKTDEPPKG